MTLKIQGPGSNSLISTLSTGLEDASECGAVFAFASREGVDIFFTADGVVDLFQKGGKVQLFIGMDAITNTRSLERVRFYQDRHGDQLDVHAVINDDPPYIFHPKFAWFVAEERMRVVVGSGNLTAAGLGSPSNGAVGCNWEAYTVQDYKGEQQKLAQRALNEWLDRMRAEGLLYELSDQRVIDAGVENSRISAARRRRPPRKRGAAAQDGVTGVQIMQWDADYAMIRELPKTRAGQADLGKRAVQLFGYVEGERETAITQPVFLDETVGDAAAKSVFKVRSSNYRIELDGLSEEEAQAIGPEDQRCILVVVRFNDSASRFCIVPVSSERYADLSEILGEVSSGRRYMREQFFESPDQLERAWPTILDPLRAVQTLPII